MNLLLGRLGMPSPSSRVSWTESRECLRHDPSSVVSQWFAQDACAAEVLNLPAGESEALVENRGDYRTCIRHWIRPQRCHTHSEAGLSPNGDSDAMSRPSVDIPVHVSPILLRSAWGLYTKGRAHERRGSDRAVTVARFHWCSRCQDIARLADKAAARRAKKSGRASSRHRDISYTDMSQKSRCTIVILGRKCRAFCEVENSVRDEEERSWCA